MSAARSLAADVCRCTPGCTGTGDHVCTVDRPVRRETSAEAQRAHRELVREMLRAQFRVTL
jgi:hypothetical protein